MLSEMQTWSLITDINVVLGISHFRRTSYTGRKGKLCRRKWKLRVFLHI